MKLEERPIGELVGRCQTWDPRADGTGSFQYIDLSSIDKDSKKITTIETYPCSDAPSRARQLVKTDDVLIATVRPNLNGVALVNGIHDGMTASTGYCVLRPKPYQLDPRYLFQWVKTETFVSRMVSVATGANYPAVSDGKVKDSTIPLPPLAEQKRIAGILDAADALRAKRREALAQLDTLLQATFLDLFGDPVTNPKRWKTRKFSDLANDSFRNGLSPSTKGKVQGEVLTLSAITGGRFKFDERKEAFFDKPPTTSQMLSTKTFLICRGNGNKKLVGSAAFPDRSSDQICFPDTMIGVTIDPKVLTAPYLQYVWASGHVRRQIECGARTTNGTFKVNQQTLASVAFPVPSIEEQMRFARCTVAIEKQRTACHAHLAELDTLFASLQSRAFRGEL